MGTPTQKTVQLIHLQGPLKGEIQEYSDQVITIGRHSSCTVRFPADMTRVSRKHAEIRKEGHRYRFVDHSTNGSFVNGKQVTDTYLQSGDVILFAEGGPKVSFLIQTTTAQTSTERSAQPPPQRTESKAEPNRQAGGHKRPHPATQDSPEDIPHQKVKAPLVIQHGPTLRSFSELPVTIGNGGGSDFILDHPGMSARHAQVSFHEQTYWVRDLTGQSKLLLNGRPIGDKAALNPQDVLAMSSEGPFFVFLGGGRLAEAEPEG